MKLYNPSAEDITQDVDKKGEHPESFTLKAGDIQEVPDHITPLLIDALVERMLWASPPSNKNYEKRRQELRKLITVV